MWKRERMLIWGKTYPELSKKYTETVCTGAVFLDRPGLIRIYPLDFRYLPESQRPTKWSIITAEVMRNTSDARPESYKIKASTIQIESVLSTKDGWRDRLLHMIKPDHMVSGLEELEQRQSENKMSLGIVKPNQILDVRLKKSSDADLHEFDEKYKEITSQQELWPPGEKPLPMPTYKPYLKFRCQADSKEYERTILDWEVVELAKRHFGQSDPSLAFKESMFQKAFSAEHDPYLVLGNISNHPHIFVIVCVIYPKKQAQEQQAQMSLFD